MKTRILLIGLILAAMLSACASSQTPQTPVETQINPPTETAQSLVPLPEDRLDAGRVIADLFVQQDFDAVVGYFDETMQESLTAAQLQQAWVSLAQLGAFQSLGEARSEQYQQYDIVFVRLQFAQGDLDLKVVFDQSGHIAGLFFVPVEDVSTESSYLSPSYADPASFDEQEVTIGSGEWALPGSLSLPKGDGPFPALVLVHGSGPNDRNEQIGPNRPFQDLAWGLASRGIAVLRYDKRTLTHAAKFTSEILATLTVQEETLDDALLAVALLRQIEQIDAGRIYVLGHSLGGMLLPRLGAQDAHIAGLIVMAGPTRPLEEIYLEQVNTLARLDGSLTEAEKQAITEVEAQVELAQSAQLSSQTPAQQLPLQIPAAYWLDLRGYVPAETARTLSQPMLILQGERDYQVSVVDFDLWKAALADRAAVEFRLYPDLNHLFIAGEGPGSPEEYERPGHVAEEVIEDIARWMTSPSQ